MLRIWPRRICWVRSSASFRRYKGLMGKYYALAQGEDASVAAACEEHC